VEVFNKIKALQQCDQLWIDMAAFLLKVNPYGITSRYSDNDNSSIGLIENDTKF
jgi:hypothetical protein